MRRRHARRPAHFHAVRFYTDSDSQCRIVGDFLAQGLADNQPSVVIATKEHRAGIVRELERRGLDVAGLQERSELVLRDANEALATFMVNGRPDPARFRYQMGKLFRRARGARTGCTVRAYGEMVDVLWKAGQNEAAIRLEVFWNELANAGPFSVMCGYSLGSFFKDAALADVRQRHTHGDRVGGSRTAPRSAAPSRRYA